MNLLIAQVHKKKLSILGMRHAKHEEKRKTINTTI